MLCTVCVSEGGEERRGVWKGGREKRHAGRYKSQNCRCSLFKFILSAVCVCVPLTIFTYIFTSFPTFPQLLSITLTSHRLFIPPLQTTTLLLTRLHHISPSPHPSPSLTHTVPLPFLPSLNNDPPHVSYPPPFTTTHIPTILFPTPQIYI